MSALDELEDACSDLYTHERALHAVADIAMGNGAPKVTMHFVQGEDLYCLMATLSQQLTAVRQRIQRIQEALERST
jgi:hypothetical protein